MKAEQKRLTQHQSRKTLRAEKIARLRRRRQARQRRHLSPPYQVKPVLQHVLQEYGYLLNGVMAAPRERQQVLRLVRRLYAHDPMMLHAAHLPWMLLLARHRWVRPLHTWRGPRGCQSTVRDHLIRHLLVLHPVPEFLFLAFERTRKGRGAVVLEDAWAVPLLACLGRGDSLRTLAGTEALPTPLTRRMRHEFLSASRHMRPTVALRQVQIAAGGGDVALLSPIIDSRLGRLHVLSSATDERFWDGVIRWLCRRPDSTTLRPKQWEALLRWLELRARQGEPIGLKGRPLTAVLRQVEALGVGEERASEDGFPSSGLRSLTEGLWSLHEIRTPRALHEEGTVLSHCVWSYGSRIRSHQSAIWSLRHEGTPTVTVEVDLRLGCIRQARGFANRACRPEEVAVLRRWAMGNGLALVG